MALQTFVALPWEERFIEEKLGLTVANPIMVGSQEEESTNALPLIPGISIAVIHDGNLAWARGYGVCDSENQERVDEQTLFQAASISKSLSAVATLRLVDEGMLALDENIQAYLTSWQVPLYNHRHVRITLRQLLCHAAGLSAHGFPGYSRDAALPTLQEVLEGHPPALTPRIQVDFLPGTEFCYSGPSYCVLQQLLMDVTGLSFPVLMQKLVLEPLSMTHSTFCQPLPADFLTNATSGHRMNGIPLKGKWYVYPEMAAAGLWTTPSDLARFIIGIQRAYSDQSGAFISQELIRQMLTPQLADFYGLGIVTAGQGRAQRFAHSGSNEGFRCYFEACVQRGLGMVVMTNAERGTKLLGKLRQWVADVYHWPRVLEGNME